MNDAIALLAISQLVCLGAIFYLYAQLQELKGKAPAKRRQPSTRVHRMPGPAEVAGHSTARAARAAYAQPASATVVQPASPLRGDLASLVARSNGVVDIAALARRLRKSEEEVRLLLRRQGIAS